MSAPVDAEQLYGRGPIQSNGKPKYRLEWDLRRDGSLRSPFLQIVWYDSTARRNRSRSSATADIFEAEKQLDAIFLERERGQAVCASCGQVISGGTRYELGHAIADYLVARKGRTSFDTIQDRLDHVSTYLTETGRLGTCCEDVDEEWVEAFREWAIEVPVVSPGGKVRDRAPGTVEGSVRMLSAAINFAHRRKDTLYPAAFTAKKPEEVSKTPSYRADVEMLGKMFAYALQINVKTHEPFKSRENLLRFLRISVATWARPDAAHDVSTDRERSQWHPQHQALDLNPRGRPQTKKYRPIIPLARQMVADLNSNEGFYVRVESVKSAFESMLDELELPRAGETGMKLIRRSMAKLARARLGEAQWIEGQMMLGHRKHSSTSDHYAPFEPGYLSNARRVTEEIIDEICEFVPNAFHRPDTGLRVINGGRNA